MWYLKQGIQGISDLIAVPNLINLDFADVKTVMHAKGNCSRWVLEGLLERIGAQRQLNEAIRSFMGDINHLVQNRVLLNITGGV